MSRPRTKLLAAAAALMLPGMALAGPLSAIEDGFTILASPDSVTATGLGFGGWGPAENLIDGDLSTGTANLRPIDVLTFTFGTAITNGTGADLVIVDSQFDSAGVEVSLDGFASFQSFDASDFYDTGVDDAIISERGDSFPFRAFALLVDLSDFGLSATDSIMSFGVRSTDSGTGFDPVEVAAITSGTTVAPVPLPAGLSLLLAGLGGLGLIRRKRAAK